MKPVCGTCPFYEPQTEDGLGYCQRSPPVLHLGVGSTWPTVKAVRDFCGEHPSYARERIAAQIASGIVSAFPLGVQGVAAAGIAEDAFHIADALIHYGSDR